MQERITAMIKREVAAIEHNISTGACPDYIAYREQVSMLTAFRVATEIVKKAFAEDEDDEDDQ